MYQKTVIMTLSLMLLTLSYSFDCMGTEDELPKELRSNREIKAFQKRDFFKEVKTFSSSIKSCRTRTCSSREETKIFERLWGVLYTKVNQMAWMCDYTAYYPHVINAKGNETLIKPLLKRMKYCKDLNEKFQSFVYDNCLELLNSNRTSCSRFKVIADDNLRRVNAINSLATYD